MLLKLNQIPGRLIGVQNIKKCPPAWPGLYVIVIVLVREKVHLITHDHCSTYQYVLLDGLGGSVSVVSVLSQMNVVKDLIQKATCVFRTPMELLDLTQVLHMYV